MLIFRPTFRALIFTGVTTRRGDFRRPGEVFCAVLAGGEVFSIVDKEFRVKISGEFSPNFCDKLRVRRLQGEVTVEDGGVLREFWPESGEFISSSKSSFSMGLLACTTRCGFNRD